MTKIINGDSIKELKKFPDNYFHSVVTDPPYGLSFMGKKWDYDVPSVELWQEVFRVLKEGGYLLSFAGTRTQHRMAVNIEDAGFEIRDMIAWVYGSGFPKSHNIGKAVDKLGENPNGWIEFSKTYKKIVKESKYNHNDIDNHLKIKSSSCYWARIDYRGGLPPKHHWERIKEFIGLGNMYDDLYNETERKILGTKKVMGKTDDIIYGKYKGGIINITKGNSEWEGWGTALKPALEPITMARKPFKTSVAENVLKNGVGGINIDGCRVGAENISYRTTSYKEAKTGEFSGQDKKNHTTGKKEVLGRFPANFIHDGSDEVKDLLEESSRFFYCAKASKKDRNEGLEDLFIEKKIEEVDMQRKNNTMENICPTHKKINCICGWQPKPKKNYHPTVKPTDLMRYLVRLVTPKNGIVLDCFMGSGSTGKACALEGFNFVGIDLDKDYCKIAKARIDKATEDKRIMESQTKLF